MFVVLLNLPFLFQASFVLFCFFSEVDFSLTKVLSNSFLFSPMKSLVPKDFGETRGVVVVQSNLLTLDDPFRALDKPLAFSISSYKIAISITCVVSLSTIFCICFFLWSMCTFMELSYVPYLLL
jgi:hypothetical protein